MKTVSLTVISGLFSVRVENARIVTRYVRSSALRKNAVLVRKVLA